MKRLQTVLLVGPCTDSVRPSAVTLARCGPWLVREVVGASDLERALAQDGADLAVVLIPADQPDALDFARRIRTRHPRLPMILHRPPGPRSPDPNGAEDRSPRSVDEEALMVAAIHSVLSGDARGSSGRANLAAAARPVLSGHDAWTLLDADGQVLRWLGSAPEVIDRAGDSGTQPPAEGLTLPVRLHEKYRLRLLAARSTPSPTPESSPRGAVAPRDRAGESGAVGRTEPPAADAASPGSLPRSRESGTPDAAAARPVPAVLPAAVGGWPIVLYAASPRHGTTWVSENVRTHFGFPPTACIVDPEYWSARVHPEDGTRRARAWAELPETGAFVEEYRWQGPDGRWLWIHEQASWARDEATGQPRVLGFWLDITVQRSANESREALATIVEHAADAIFGLTPGGTLTTWNRAAERAFGWSAGEVLGRSIALLCDASDRDPVLEALRLRCAGHDVPPIEFEAVRKDGGRAPVALTLSALPGTAGITNGIAAIARDISLRRRAEAELRELNRRITRQQEDLTKYHEILTHEVSNSAMALLGLVDRMRTARPGPLGPRQEDLLRRIRRQATEIHGTAERGRLLLQLHSDDFPAAREPMPAGSVLKRVREFVQTVHFDRVVEVRIDCPGDLVFDVAGGLECVLRTLVDQAVRSCPRDGRGHVRVDVEPETRSGGVRVIVRGEGTPPIEPNEVDGIEGRPTTRRANGRIRLSLVRDFAQRVGGSVETTVTRTPEGPIQTVTLHLPEGLAWRAS